MFQKAKIGLFFAAFILMFAAVPGVNADPLQIITETSGFKLFGLGNNGNGTTSSDFDVLIGDPHSNSNAVNSAEGSFTTVINPLTFIQDFTGVGSEGTFPISFSQLLTVNGQTQTLNMFGSLTMELFTTRFLSYPALLFSFSLIRSPSPRAYCR